MMVAGLRHTEDEWRFEQSQKPFSGLNKHICIREAHNVSISISPTRLPLSSLNSTSPSLMTSILCDYTQIKDFGDFILDSHTFIHTLAMMYKRKVPPRKKNTKPYTRNAFRTSLASNPNDRGPWGWKKEKKNILI